MSDEETVGFWFLERGRKACFHWFLRNNPKTLCKEHLPIRLSLSPNDRLPTNVTLRECKECEDLSKRMRIMKELAE